jgi:hypothetical protein
MLVSAIRTYEPWTVASVIFAVVALLAVVGVLILAARGRNR